MVSPSLPALAAAFPDSAGMVTFSRNRIAHLPDVWVRGEHPTSGRKSAGSGQRLQRRAVALSLLGEEGRDVHEDPVVLDQVAAHAERARYWKRSRHGTVLAGEGHDSLYALHRGAFPATRPHSRHLVSPPIMGKKRETLSSICCSPSAG